MSSDFHYTFKRYQIGFSTRVQCGCRRETFIFDDDCNKSQQRRYNIDETRLSKNNNIWNNIALHIRTLNKIEEKISWIKCYYSVYIIALILVTAEWPVVLTGKKCHSMADRSLLVVVGAAVSYVTTSWQRSAPTSQEWRDWFRVKAARSVTPSDINTVVIPLHVRYRSTSQRAPQHALFCRDSTRRSAIKRRRLPHGTLSWTLNNGQAVGHAEWQQISENRTEISRVSGQRCYLEREAESVGP